MCICGLWVRVMLCEKQDSLRDEWKKTGHRHTCIRGCMALIGNEKQAAEDNVWMFISTKGEILSILPVNCKMVALR